MDSDNTVFVNFNKWCPKCKHYFEGTKHNPNIGIYDGEKWSGKDVDEEVNPCCDCLETGARYGTEVPEKWEEK